MVQRMMLSQDGMLQEDSVKLILLPLVQKEDSLLFLVWVG